MDYSTIWPYLLSLIVFLIFFEQLSYLKKKSSLPGPSLIFPFIGNAISLVRNPTNFWDRQSILAKSSHHGLSANYIIGIFILFVRSTDLSHKIFANKNRALIVCEIVGAEGERRE